MIEPRASIAAETQRIALFLYDLFTRPGRYLDSILTAIGANCSHCKRNSSLPRTGLTTIDAIVKLPTFRGQFHTGTIALGGLCHGTQGTQAPYPGVQA